MEDLSEQDALRFHPKPEPMDESGVQMSEEVLGSTRPALNGRFVTGAEAQLRSASVSSALRRSAPSCLNVAGALHRSLHPFYQGGDDAFGHQSHEPAHGGDLLPVLRHAPVESSTVLCANQRLRRTHALGHVRHARLEFDAGLGRAPRTKFPRNYGADKKTRSTAECWAIDTRILGCCRVFLNARLR